MKKIISMLLALSMLFVLCACKLSAETVVAEANSYLEQKNANSEAYSFIGDYSIEANEYVIAMYVDDSKMTEFALKSTNPTFVKATMIELKDNDEDEIKSTLKSIQYDLNDYFDESDVELVLIYVKYNGDAYLYEHGINRGKIN